MSLNASRTWPKRNAIGIEEEPAWAYFYSKRRPRTPLDAGSSKELQQVVLVAVDFVGERLIWTSQADGLVQSFEQDVKALTIATHEHD